MKLNKETNKNPGSGGVVGAGHRKNGNEVGLHFLTAALEGKREWSGEMSSRF